MDTLSLGLPAPPSEIIRTRYQNRLPSALDDLTGPAHGTALLPLHVAISPAVRSVWESAFPDLSPESSSGA